MAAMLAVGAAWAEDAPVVRLFNGTPMAGGVGTIGAEGLEIIGGDTNKVFPWSAFSTATRYRFDPLFRANLALAQRGRPPGEWTNAPVSTAAVAVASVSGGMTLAALPTLPARPRGRLAGLSVSEADRAVSWALQYGAGANDVLYLVLEGTREGALPMQLFVWKDPDQKPEVLRGNRRGTGDEAVVSFKRQRAQAMREGVAVQYDLSVYAAAAKPGELNISMDVSLKQGGSASMFTLTGVPAGLLVGDGAIEARDVLMLPDMRWRARSGMLIGVIRMGRLSFTPRSGMEKEATVSLVNAQGVRALEGKTLLREQGGAAVFELPIAGLVGGVRYTVRSRIDLGPFVGTLQGDEPLLAP